MRWPALLIAAAFAAGCAPRAAPHRFTAPLLAGVSLDASPLAPAPDRVYETRRDAQVRDVAHPQRVYETRRPGDERVYETRRPGDERVYETRQGGEERVDETREGALRAPHREGAAVVVSGNRTLDELRTLVGGRHEGDALAFARAVAGAMRGIEIGEISLAGLVEAKTDGERVGDLLVFGRDGEPFLVAAAVAIDGRGVTEMLYVAGGVVRRGFVDTARQRTRRDEAGVIVNTFLRHDRSQPPKGTRYLAGELLIARVDPARL